MVEDNKTKNLTKNVRGVTLLALVVTIIVLIILAAIGIGAMTGNGITIKADETKNRAEKVSIIGSAKEDVAAMQLVNEETLLTKEELKKILDKYFINVPNDYTLNTDLTTKEQYGNHTIKVSEIYNDKFLNKDSEGNDVTLILSKDKVTLDKTLNPSEKLTVTGQNYGALEWRSSDETKVTVNNGVINANGNTVEPVVISVSSGGTTAICYVTVVTSPKEIKISPNEDISLDFAMQDSKQLPVSFIPEDSNVNTELEWSVQAGIDIIEISNSGIVSLNKNKYSTTEGEFVNVYAKNKLGVIGTKIIEVKDSRKYGITINAKSNTYCTSLGTTPIIFSIKAEKNGKVVYDDIVEIDVNKTGNYTKTVLGIAETGSVVTIKPIYTGPNNINGNEGVILKIEGKNVSADFSLDYNGHIISPAYLNL